MRKRTRRKVWNVAYNAVRAAVVSHAFNGKSINLEIQELMALDEIRSGRFDDRSLKVIEAMIAISRRLALDGIGAEMVQICDRAERTLAAIRRSHMATTDQIEVLTEAAAWHKAQRELAGPAVHGRAAAPFCRLN